MEEQISILYNKQAIEDFAIKQLEKEFETNRAIDVLKVAIKNKKHLERFLIERYRDDIEKEFNIKVFNDCMSCYFRDKGIFTIRLYDNMFSAVGNIKTNIRVETDLKSEHKTKLEEYLKKNHIFLIDTTLKYIVYEKEEDCRLL